MDNAPYHSICINKIPNTSTKKQDIMHWLEQNGIHFSPSETKTELLQKVLPFKNRQKIYELDQLANERGHEIIRLPPYHCQYNAIELIWAQVKREVAKKNTTFKISDVERLVHDELDKVTCEDWARCVRHVEKLQEEDFEKEIGREEILEQIVINLADESESDSEEDEDDDDDDEPLASLLS